MHHMDVWVGRLVFLGRSSGFPYVPRCIIAHLHYRGVHGEKKAFLNLLWIYTLISLQKAILPSTRMDNQNAFAVF